MKQSLWLLNSSLLVIFITTLVLNIYLLEKKRVLLKKQLIEKKRPEEKEIQQKPLDIEKIYTQDLFDTYVATPKIKPTKKDLITPIPEYEPHQIAIPPEPAKPTFIDSLNLKLSGIISSLNEEKSIALILDETNKESIYRLGNLFKDGQIIKISKNRVIVLRANGQQEIYLLREENATRRTTPNFWEYTIKKIDNINFIVDPDAFIKRVKSLGQALEKYSLIPAYENGKLIGLKIGNSCDSEIVNITGLKKGDIFTNICDIKTTQDKNRIKIFDKITKSKIGNTIKLVLKRNNNLITINYKLEKIEKPIKKIFLSPAEPESEEQAPSTSEMLKQSKEQERAKQIKKFEKQHRTPKQEDIITDIKKRILQSMNARSMNRRIR